MTLAVDSTSVPTWAVVPTRLDADVSGRYWTVVAFDDDDDGRVGTGTTADMVATWLR